MTLIIIIYNCNHAMNPQKYNYACVYWSFPFVKILDETRPIGLMLTCLNLNTIARLYLYSFQNFQGSV